jgi:transposase
MCPGHNTLSISESMLKKCLVDDGMTDKRAAEFFGVSRMTISRMRNKLGIAPKPKNPEWKYALTAEQNLRIEKLYYEGKNDYEVASEMCLGRTRLREWRRANDILSKTNKKGLTEECAKTAINRAKLGESFTSIGKSFGVSRSSVTRLLNRYGIEYEKRRRNRPLSVDSYVITERQMSVLIGDMFGDGHLESASEETAYYYCAHKIDQESFVAWKFNVFKPISNRFGVFDMKNRKDPNQPRVPYVSMTTWSCPQLRQLQRMYYPTGSGNKIFIKEIVDMLDPLGLAVWYMGDGSISRNRGAITVGKDVDVLPIVEAINNKFGEIFKAALYEKQWWIHTVDSDKFFSMICPYIIDSMKYKVPEKYLHYCTPKSIDFGFVYGNKQFCQQSFKKLTQDEKDHLVEDACSFYQHRGFPYPSYTELDRRRDFYALKGNSIVVEDFNFKVNTLGHRMCNHFYSHRYDARRWDKRGIKDLWNNPERFRLFMYNRLNNFEGCFTDNTIRVGATIAGLPTNFSPAIAKHIYQTYLPKGGSVLDFSAGYGGRVLGCAASGLCGEYVGVDPLLESYQSFTRMTEEVCRWESLPTDTFRLINQPFEDLTFEHGHFDLVFSSPPYYGLELYSEDNTQSIKRYPEYSTWLTEFWFTVLSRSFDCLKVGGCLAFSLSDYRDYHLIADTISFMSSLPVDEEACYKIPYRNAYRGSLKYEPLFVFRKR